MGLCSSKKKIIISNNCTMEKINMMMPSPKSSISDKVKFFDMQQLSMYLRKNSKSCEDDVKNFIQKLAMNDQIVESLEEIKELCKIKGEVLIRSYNDRTDLALKVMQKVFEFYQNYFLQYLQVSTDLPIVKNIISEQTLQLTIECVLIVNALMDKNLSDSDRWWTTQYFSTRTKVIQQTSDQEKYEISIQISPPLKLDTKEEFISPFLEFLLVMKLRLGMTIQLKQSMVQSINASIQITQNQQNVFYQSLKDGLAISVTDQIEPLPTQPRQTINMGQIDVECRSRVIKND